MSKEFRFQTTEQESPLVSKKNKEGGGMMIGVLLKSDAIESIRKAKAVLFLLFVILMVVTFIIISRGVTPPESPQGQLTPPGQTGH